MLFLSQIEYIRFNNPENLNLYGFRVVSGGKVSNFNK